MHKINFFKKMNTTIKSTAKFHTESKKEPPIFDDFLGFYGQNTSIFRDFCYHWKSLKMTIFWGFWSVKCLKLNENTWFFFWICTKFCDTFDGSAHFLQNPEKISKINENPHIQHWFQPVFKVCLYGGFHFGQ